MELENIDFRGINYLVKEKELELLRVDLNIDSQLLTLERLDKDDSLGSSECYKAIESLRFSRNKARSELLDIQSHLKTLKRRYFEERLMAKIKKYQPELYESISNNVKYCEGSQSIEVEILAQERKKTYRKIDQAFQDILIINSKKEALQNIYKHDQSHPNQMSLDKSLIRSKRFFSRQCATIKAIRDEIHRLSMSDYSYAFYIEAVNQIGRAGVDGYGEEICSRKAA